MKKYTLIIIAVAIICMGASMTTRPEPYKTLGTLTDAAAAVDTDLAAATGFKVGKIAGEIDLISRNGAGRDTYANNIVLLVNATGAADGDTVTQKLYGRVDNGPPQLIASIDWTIGTARVDGSTATYLWADAAVVTSYHATETIVSTHTDGVTSVTFDAIGYRYLYSRFSAQTGDMTLVTCLYRSF